MPRVALPLLCLALCGCGYSTWWNPPFSSGTNPHFPVGDSENMRRVTGEHVDTPQLTPEPGDIWPGPLPPTPTLQELEQQGTPSGPERPVPGSPEFQGQPPNLPGPPPAPGSSTPPVSNQQGLPPLPAPRPSSPAPVTPPAAGPPLVTPTPQGPAVSTGGGPGYQTTTTPGGGSAIIVPNGNGTSTIIHSDGRIETVPTPK